MENQHALAISVVIIVALSLASCRNYEHAYSKNFDFPPPDSSMYILADVPSAKMCEMRSGKSTGTQFVNAVQFGLMQDNNLYVKYYNGGGAAVLNYNHDSLPERYFTGNIVPDELYENEGNFHFQKV